MMQTLIDLQGAIHEAVNGLFGRFAETGDWRSLFVILPLGIAFGAIHALTPGHSKIVLASYLVGSRLPLKRSTFVAGALAFTHILSAVVLALLAAPLLSRTIGGVGRAPSLDWLVAASSPSSAFGSSFVRCVIARMSPEKG